MTKTLATMTAAQFTRAIERLGLTRYNAGARLGLSRGQVYRISADRSPVPAPVALLLAMYLRHGLPEGPSSARPS